MATFFIFWVSYLVDSFLSYLPVKRILRNKAVCHSVAEKGHFEICMSMVGKVQDLRPRDNYGYTPYHIAALNGHEKVSNLLMNLTDPNPKDNSGRTPLDLAALNGHLEVCRPMAVRVVEFSNGGYKIRKIFA